MEKHCDFFISHFFANKSCWIVGSPPNPLTDFSSQAHSSDRESRRQDLAQTKLDQAFRCDVSHARNVNQTESILQIVWKIRWSACRIFAFIIDNIVLLLMHSTAFLQGADINQIHCCWFFQFLPHLYHIAVLVPTGRIVSLCPGWYCDWCLSTLRIPDKFHHLTKVVWSIFSEYLMPVCSMDLCNVYIIITTRFCTTQGHVAVAYWSVVL